MAYTTHDRYGAAHTTNGGVRYWSCYQQVWKVAYSREQVSDEDYSGLTESDREMLELLAPEASQ